MTDVQTKDGQLVSIQRQEELEQRREFGSDRNVRACGWIQRTGQVLDPYLQRVCVEEFDGAVQQRDSQKSVVGREFHTQDVFFQLKSALVFHRQTPV